MRQLATIAVRRDYGPYVELGRKSFKNPMPLERVTPIWRVLSWTVVICTPAWLMIGVLAMLDSVSAVDAIVAGSIVYILTVVLSFTFLRDFDRLIRYAEDLHEDPMALPPEIERSKAARRLATALSTLQQSWSEHREVASSLAQSRAAILDSLPDPFLLIDKDRVLTGANKAAIEVFGDQVSGRDLATVIRDPSVLDAIDQALHSGTGGFAELTLSKPVERHFGCMIGVLPNSSLDNTAILFQLHDMTDRVKMDSMRADFVANASHELRTPLSSVLGFIETLQGPAKDDEEARARFLDIMLKQANLMARLIDDLLSLSRVELREHSRPTDTVDVAAVLKSTCELLDMQAKDNKVELKFDFTENPALALGDFDELGQVFHNLISNAIKYGGIDSEVQITLSKEQIEPHQNPGGPWVCVAVQDHGEGIAPEHIPRLTERFYRIDTARSRELGGTGLGLAIVKHIVKRHRGHLVIDSELGKGSVFKVFLPVAEPGAAEE